MTRLKAEMQISNELRHLEGKRKSLRKMIVRSSCEEQREALRIELWNVKARQDRLSNLNREVM